MALEILDVLTRFVLPPLLGGAGGMAAVLLNWDVEKRRERRKHRAQLVNRWRLHLIPELERDGAYILERDGGHSITGNAEYPSLRPHLSKELRDKLESSAGDPNDHRDLRRASARIVVNGAPSLRRRVLNEIDQIERRWGLV